MAFVMANEGRKMTLAWVGHPATGRLWKAPTDGSLPTPTNVYADYTQADFSGYAYVGTQLYAARTVGNAAVKSGLPMDFVHNGGATANDIYGFMADVDYNGNRIGASQMTMVPMANKGDRISIAFNFWNSGDTSNPNTPTVQFNNVCELNWCDALYATNQYMAVQLFSSDHTPATTDTYASMSPHLYGGGTNPVFSAGATTVGGIATKTSNHMSFRQTSDQTPAVTIYGYSYWYGYGATLIGSERFASPIDFSHDGDLISFGIKCSLWSLV